MVDVPTSHAMSHQLVLTAHGRLLLEEVAADGALAFPGEESWGEAFAVSSARGLQALATRRGAPDTWPAELAFWREFADTFLTALAHAPAGVEGQPAAATVPPADQFFALTLRLPAMRGAEYASPEVFANLRRELEAEARELAGAAGGIKPWLAQINPALHLVGKVTFHLAENKRSPETPFAFMATYTHRLSARKKTRRGTPARAVPA